MKFLRILLLLSVSFNLAMAQQSAGIKGRVTTADGHGAGYVSVKLLGKPFGATTDKNGDYTIAQVTPGKYTIKVSAIGLSSQTRSIEVIASAIVTADFILNEKLSTLTEVNISTNKRKYKTDKVSTSLRLAAPLLEIPQNIQVVTSAALADQQIISMSDGLIRNVSGAVRLEHWGDLYANILMRGSQIQAFRNGFNVVSSFWGPLTEDMSFVDHIEFVKGPAGFMLANGDPSGLYNVVTKKPTGETKGEVSMTLGSYDLYRTAVDLDGKLSRDGRLLYRLNAAGQNKKSHRANEYNNRYSFAPVISYQLDDKTKITAEYTLQYAKMSDIGSYYAFSPFGYGTLPVDFTAMPPGLSPTRINDHSAFLNLEHQLSDQWKLTAQGSYFNYSQSGTSMWPSDVNAQGKMIRAVGIWDAKSEMTMGQVFLNGAVKTGSVQHRILAGLDVGTKDYMADWAQGHNLDTVGGEFDPLNPVYGAPANGYPQYDRTLDLPARAVKAGGIMDQRYSGIYVQDELGFLENKIRLTLAGRYTYVTQSQWGGAQTKAKHFSPRIGLSVSVDKNLSVYGLYDQAFIPQGGKLAGGGNIKPVTGNNMEIGLKKDWFDGKWNTTISAYRIIKKNELTGDPNSAPNSGLSVVLGEKTSQGIEFDLKGEILTGLNAMVNYAYTDSKVTEATAGTSFIKGQLTPGFAKHTINSWLEYKVQDGALKGTGLSGSFTYLIDRATANYSTTNPEQNLPDYFKLNAGAFWEKDKIKLTLNVFNLLDKYLYSGSYYTNYFSSPAYSWQTEAPRNYRLTLTYKF